MHEAEWLTRKQRIDKRLQALNPQWQIVPCRHGLDVSALTCHAVTEFPTSNGPADYALFVNGLLLGILEAKKVTVNPQNVLERAKRVSASGRASFNLAMGSVRFFSQFCREPPIKDATLSHRVEVNLREVGQLFNTMDHSPF